MSDRDAGAGAPLPARAPALRVSAAPASADLGLAPIPIEAVLPVPGLEGQPSVRRAAVDGDDSEAVLLVSAPGAGLLRISSTGASDHRVNPGAESVRPTPDIAVHRVTWADGVPVDAKRGVRRLEVIVDGWRFELDVESEARAALMDRARRERGTATSGGATEVRAMIPGRVLAVTVAVGDAVEAGQRLLVIEAMKMQNELRAPRSGVVTDVRVAADRTVELGDLLLTIGDAPAPAASGEREPPTGATPTGEIDSGAARSR